MSRFWPHTPFAEDQPYPHAILYTHVLTRAIQAGAVVGSASGAAWALLRRSRGITPPTFAATILRSTGVGAVVGTGLLAVGLPMRMWGREEIEWKDRSWRLLENKGQVEVDDWTYGGMALGLVSAVASGRRNLGWRGAVGRVGMGSVVGMLGYMGWRYGIHGGKRESEGTKS